MRALARRAENTFLPRPPLPASCSCRSLRSPRGNFSESGIPGSAPFAQNLTLWVGMLGAAIAARDGKLLVLATGEFLPKHLAAFGHIVGAFVGAAVATIFAVGGVEPRPHGARSRRNHRPQRPGLGGRSSVFPVAFALIAARLVWRASPHWTGRVIAASGHRRRPAADWRVRRSSKARRCGRGFWRFSSPACSARRFSRCSAASRCSGSSSTAAGRWFR